jgi:hypothetical protein
MGKAFLPSNPDSPGPAWDLKGPSILIISLTTTTPIPTTTIPLLPKVTAAPLDLLLKNPTPIRLRLRLRPFPIIIHSFPLTLICQHQHHL